MPHGAIGYPQLVHIHVERQYVMVYFQFHQWNGKIFHHTQNLQPETAEEIQFKEYSCNTKQEFLTI